MEENLLIPALLRLLDTASIRRFKLKDKTVEYSDAVGQKALDIAADIKKKFKLDIFSENMSIQDLTQFEHTIGVVMSNFVKNKLVPRKISDEVQILKDSKSIATDTLNQFEIDFAPNISYILDQIETIKDDELLSLAKKPLSLSCLPGKELTDQYFSLSIIKLENREVFIVFTLRHESGDPKSLSIISFIVLPTDEYLRYQLNPTQLFLKGLDKFGIDMKIDNRLSRYYSYIELPLTTNIYSPDFLDLQNLEGGEACILAMTIKPTSKSFEMKNVFAIRERLLVDEMNKKTLYKNI